MFSTTGSVRGSKGPGVRGSGFWIPSSSAGYRIPGSGIKVPGTGFLHGYRVLCGMAGVTLHSNVRYKEMCIPRDWGLGQPRWYRAQP